jgi:hypothetical protein
MTQDYFVRDIAVQLGQVLAELTAATQIETERKLRDRIEGPVDRSYTSAHVARGETLACFSEGVDRAAVQHRNQFERRGGDHTALDIHLIRAGQFFAPKYISQVSRGFPGKFIGDPEPRRLTFSVLRILLVLISAVTLFASENASKLASSVAKMQSAIERQRASVRRQSTGADPGQFFTTPWLDGPRITAVSAVDVQADCDPLPPEQLRKHIVNAATAEGVNPLLLQAMVARESAGRPCAVSAKGAQGLMQIMPPTQADLGLADAFDPASNISAGARYVKQLLARYKGDLRLALAAYNAGPQRVDADNQVPAIPETQAYVSAIMSALKSPDEPSQPGNTALIQ